MNKKPVSMFNSSDYQWMARALQLAKRGLYTCDPNPKVGCVLVKDGRMVGEGWHQRAGQAHAEVNAINAAGADAAGSTAYVTLEPCCHSGKTPPCTDAIIHAQIEQVVIATEDPNPAVSGKGIDALQQAGIKIQIGLLGEQARQLNSGHFMRMMHNRPFVRLKLACSLDGRTALASGESQWITGKDARDDVQRLRAKSSAIMTSIATVLADDPSLNVRIESLRDEYRGDIRQPLRVVLDSRLRMPASARMLKLPGDILIVTTVDHREEVDRKLELLRTEKQDLEIITVPGDAENRCDLQPLMSVLATAGINELTVECGPVLAGSLLRHQLIDELVCYLAPTILGDTAQGLFSIPEISSMDHRGRLKILDLRKIGADYRLLAEVNRIP